MRSPVRLTAIRGAGGSVIDARLLGAVQLVEGISRRRTLFEMKEAGNRDGFSHFNRTPISSVLRTTMHVIPGNIIDAGVTEIVRPFGFRSHHHRLVDRVRRQTIEHAAARGPETAAPGMVMMRSGE
jgi:hypothetical protein